MSGQEDRDVDTARALRESEGLYRSLVEGSIQGLLIVSEARKPLFANQAAADIFGYGSPAGILALESTAVLIAPHALSRQNAIREQFFRDPSHAPQTYDIEGRHRDGSILHLEFRAGVIEWKGEPAAQITFFDVSERKRAEAKLRQSQRMEAIGQLTGGVAHNFNNLLSVILGNAELLHDSLRSGGNAQDREQIEEIITAGRRGRDAMQQLLAFARRQTLRPRAVDLARLASDLAELLQPALGDRIEVAVKLAPALWPVVADAGQLEIALVNLALNAKDAMPDSGAFTIACANLPAEAESGQDFVEVTVSDNGSGMTPEVLERAFEPFFTTKAFGQGSGLGLSMVYGFAKQSGGDVSLTSASGRGTVVKVTLPRAEA